MPMFVGQSDARLAWMQGQADADIERRRQRHEQVMRDKAQRDDVALAQQEMAVRQQMQREAIAASQAQQRFAADRQSSDEYNARNDAYSAANDPMRRQAMNRDLDFVADRQANLMGTQAGLQRMATEQEAGFASERDHRLSALKQNEMMLAGGIDSMRLSQQHGQNLEMQTQEAKSARSLQELRAMADRGNIVAQGQINMAMQQQGHGQTMQRDQAQAGYTMQRDQAQAGHAMQQDVRRNVLEMGRDKLRSGLAMDEDAWSRMQNRKAALMEMENQEKASGLQLSEPDQRKRDALWEEYRAVEDLMDRQEINPRQGLTRQDEITRKIGQMRATQKPVPLSQRFEQESVKMPDGRVAVWDAKKGWDISMPPAGQTHDPGQVKRDYELKLNDSISKAAATRVEKSANAGKSITYEDAVDHERAIRGLPPMPKPKDEDKPVGGDPQELFRHVQNVNAAAEKAGIPVRDFVEQLGQRNPEAVEAYVAGIRMIQQTQGDPRAGAMQQGQPAQAPPRPQRMVPGQSGPVVDPRVMQMQGRPVQGPVNQAVSASQPVGTVRRPFVGATPQRPAATPAPAQQAAAAIEVFNVIKNKYGGKLPPKGSQDEQDYIQAATFLHQSGIDPTGGSLRDARPNGPMSQGYLK